MKKILVCVLVTLLLLFASSALADVPIDSVHFPDANFRAVLLEDYDFDHDGILNDEELENDFGSFSGKSISNLKGIEYFTAMNWLDCSDNLLTELDLSRGPDVSELDCSSNRLSALDISNCHISRLNCSDNDLASLNICSDLLELFCYDNPLTTLDLSSNQSMVKLVTIQDKKHFSDDGYVYYLFWEPYTLYSHTVAFDSDVTLVAGGTTIPPEAEPVLPTDNYVQISAAYFPDAEFRSMISDSFDKDGNGWLSKKEINDVTQITWIDDSMAQSLSGIEYFTELRILGCTGNLRGTVDLSQNTKLVDISVGGPDMTSLIVSGCTELRELYCSNSGLSSLDLTTNIKLERLICSDTSISSLNLVNNTGLEELYCNHTLISTINLTVNHALKVLSVDNTNLSNLDLSENPLLERLYCYHTNLISLDISNCPILKEIVETVAPHAAPYDENIYVWEIVPDGYQNEYCIYTDKNVEILTKQSLDDPAALDNNTDASKEERNPEDQESDEAESSEMASPDKKDGQSSNSPMNQDASWSDIYRQYIKNKRFLYTYVDNGYNPHYEDPYGAIYYYDPQSSYSNPGEYLWFALYDMDRNGIPELIAANGEANCNIYTVANGEMRFLGDAQMPAEHIFHFDNDQYPGIVVMYIYHESSAACYISLDNGTLKREMIYEYYYGEIEVENYFSRNGIEDYSIDEYDSISNETSDKTLMELYEKGKQKELDYVLYSQIDSLDWDAFTKGFINEQKPAGVDVLSGLSWQQAYHDFILQKEYLGKRNAGGAAKIYEDPFGNQFEISKDMKMAFGLYDWNGDDIPELFVSNTGPDTGNSVAVIYTYIDGRLSCLGRLGIRGGGPWVTVDPKYPGVLTAGGNNGISSTAYSVLLENGKINETVVYSESYFDPEDETGEPLSQPIKTVYIQDLYDAIKKDGVTIITQYESGKLKESNWKKFISSAIKKRIGSETASSNNQTDGHSPDSDASGILFYAKTKKETRVRETANKTGKLLATIKKAGTEVAVLEELKGDDGKTWYRIQLQDGTVGYARSDFFKKK
ncbi:MAG: SH3 domain-containing protein [Anaerolineaceae bacterium]|nr:SH3 domain-containing protein [Anaerolineaceae bacterium]